MATSLEISEKEVQIDHLHPKRFHSVKRLRKLVKLDPEIINASKIYSPAGKFAERAK